MINFIMFFFQILAYKNGQLKGVLAQDIFEGTYHAALSLYKNASVRYCNNILNCEKIFISHYNKMIFLMKIFGHFGKETIYRPATFMFQKTLQIKIKHCRGNCCIIFMIPDVGSRV